MYTVYIIQASRTGKYYVGCTNNIVRRLNEHNQGISKYTKTEKDWVLRYKVEFDNIVDARKREKQIKSWKKRSAIERLIHGPIV